MAQTLKYICSTLLLLTIGLSSSLPLNHKIEKRSSATVLGDLTAGASGILNSNQDFPSLSCKHLYDEDYTTSGRYRINPTGCKEITVFCDMSLQGGGWTVIQRRIDDSQAFNLTWLFYKKGFGDFDANFWLGLESIHQVTSLGTELYIGMESLDATPKYRQARYESFSVSNATNNYKLTLGDFQSSLSDSDIGDSFGDHNGAEFSTIDKDNDVSTSIHCAQQFNSGWWFATNGCHDAHLNGVWYATAASQPNGQGIIWNSWLGDDEPLSKVVIAVRSA